MVRFVVALSVSILLVTLLSESPAGAAAPVAVEVRGGRLTLRADGVPLAEVLSRLATAAGIVIELRDRADERVNVSMVGVTLEEGLRRLLKDRNTLFLYDRKLGAPSLVYVLGPRSAPTVPTSVAGLEGRQAASEADVVDGSDTDGQGLAARAILKIDGLEEEFRSESPVVLGRLRDLLADPDPTVRITALQRLTEPRDAVIDGLAAGLMDSDPFVQSVAKQIILNRNVDERAVEDVTAAALGGDAGTVRLMLSALIVR